MSVLVVAGDSYSPEVVDAKAVLCSLGAEVVRHQIVNAHALPDPENIETHDYVVLLRDKLRPEDLEQYLSYGREKEVPVLVSSSDPSCLFGDFCALRGIDLTCPESCPYKSNERKER